MIRKRKPPRDIKKVQILKKTFQNFHQVKVIKNKDFSGQTIESTNQIFYLGEKIKNKIFFRLMKETNLI